jgi:hypothetical protein
MNRRLHSPLEEVEMVAKLADLKEDHYRLTLALGAVIELLVEKGILSRREIERKMLELDASSSNQSLRSSQSVGRSK